MNTLNTNFEENAGNLSCEIVGFLVDLQNGKRNFQIGKRKWTSKRSKRKRQNGMDFIKDSAVKTVNGIKTEFAKTVKRERQDGETERQNGKTKTDKTAKGQWKSKRLNAKQWNHNDKTVKTVNGKTANGKNGKRQNGQFWNGKRKRSKRKVLIY